MADIRGRRGSRGGCLGIDRPGVDVRRSLERTERSEKNRASKMPYVFLSHSHVDRAFARRLAADLRNAGHSVWIDEAEINIGDSLISKIRGGLDQVDFVCAVLSKASVSSAWVQKELEIASNREIDEKRVVVLPLLIEQVDLPGFIQGKRYGDFRNESNYEDQLKQLLKALGPTEPVKSTTGKELEQLKKELKYALALAKANEKEAKRASEAAFRAKSEGLRQAIESANRSFPDHAPINKTYAFEVSSIYVTLDYALWAIAKSERKGSHPLAALLSIFDKWSELESMLMAYNDMLAQQTNRRKRASGKRRRN
jgi:TIR domain